MSLDSTRYLRPERADLTRIIAEARAQSPQLSTSVLLRLGQHFESALRNRSVGRNNLRSVVIEAVGETARQGGTPDAAVAFVVRFLEAHPSIHRLDRVSFVDGRRTSERLLHDVREWAAEGSERSRN